jgi:hypothetical protein
MKSHISLNTSSDLSLPRAASAGAGRSREEVRLRARSERWRRAKAFLGYAAVQVVVLVFAALIALTLHGPWARGARAHAATLPMPPTAPLPELLAPVSTSRLPEQPAPVSTAPLPELLTPAGLDRLREETIMGDPGAGRELVAMLLERYERAGDTDDLFEAVQWMDRGWASGDYQQSGLASRVFERHCGHKVLRWHWLCDRGE